MLPYTETVPQLTICKDFSGFYPEIERSNAGHLCDRILGELGEKNAQTICTAFFQVIPKNFVKTFHLTLQFLHMVPIWSL